MMLERTAQVARRIRGVRVGAMLAAISMVPPAGRATTLSWLNAAGGSAATAGNWSPSQVPGSADDLFFNLSSTYSVTFNSSVTVSRTHTYNEGTITLTASSPHTASTGVTVGDLSGDNAIVTLTTGTFTSNAAVIIGDASGSIGRINVNDDDADLIVGNAADLTVGNNGAATLSITNVGRVQVADQFIAGSNSTSAPIVTVSGFSVAPVGASTLDVLGVGQSRIGQGGDATMTVDTGALAQFAGDVVIANGSASVSSVTVQTIGLQNARFKVDGDLLIGCNTSATTAGNGTLNVNTGGTTTVGGATFLGDPNGGTGRIHMGGGAFSGGSAIDILPGSTLDGTGTINSAIDNAGNVQPTGASGLTLNGVLFNDTHTVVGSKIHFGPNGGYEGSGTCQADITGDVASTITAVGPLTIGANTAAGFSYLGALEVADQLVTLRDSNGAVLGGLTTIDNGELGCAGGLGLQLGGEIRGQGTLVGNVINAGLIDPDANGDPVAGEITIEGNYVGNPSSDLALELNGPGNSDRIHVTGTSTLGGNVILTFHPDYLPSIGEQMILLNAQLGRGTSTFASLEHEYVCDQYTIVLVYSSTAGIALIRPGLNVTSVGDVDRDGDQDLDDYERWEPCMAGPDVLTLPPGCDAGDFAHRTDLDGPACDDYDVDLKDFAVFQRILGN